MSPYSGPPHPRRWTSSLQVDGRAVFDANGHTLSKYGFEVLLGWVSNGELTDLGMQAVKDGWWVDPPDEDQAQVESPSECEGCEASQKTPEQLLEAAATAEPWPSLRLWS